ncbi:MAG TPA: flavodoxin domain-containing protein [Xanthobacteraceae bacterium]|jgi:sulfite reductase (NADPH) flavoprotein alpha-component|nr:flavodoxin domain-containing protein [Xanthobacteraceae bacterium]
MTAKPIPATAPFAEDEIHILNQVVGIATPTQRAWLAGFLSGLDAANAEAAPVAAPRTAEPLTIIYATESGNSESLAADVAKAARKLSFKPTLIDMADLDLAMWPKNKRLIVIAATWGEGEPPARATAAYNELMSDAAPRLDGVEFSVLALGDSAYADFCGVGRKIDARLEALGAKRVSDRVDCDLDFAEPAARWIETSLKALAPPDAGRGTVIPVDFAQKSAAASVLGPVEAEVTEHINLNSSRSDKETIHIELSFDGAAPTYKPGDSLDIYPENDPDYVVAFLKAAGLSEDADLRDDLRKNRDVTTLSLKALETYADVTGQQDVKALIASGEAAQWIAGRQLIDLIETYPAAITAEQLRKVTRPLAPRAYSIASSMQEVGDEAHLLVSAVRYETHGRQRKGVASNYVAERLKKGARVKVKVKPNRHFVLPAADKDVIMVGPGTGVAPFRAFVQERRATEAKGRSWLFFGDRRFNDDFLYQLEWQDALKDGILSRLDIAFSRDATEKVYVQDRIWERRADIVAWLDGGATFYVCGDAKAMAKDVRATLSRAFADVKGLDAEAAELAVRDLERNNRYQTDTY